MAGYRGTAYRGHILRGLLKLLKHSSSVLDLDTGGGERFLKLHEHWPQKVVATEHYEPNFKLATEQLTPFGAEVIDVELSEILVRCLLMIFNLILY